MKVKALISFGGEISMTQGQEKDLPAGKALEDLLQAGYVERISTGKKTAERDAK